MNTVGEGVHQIGKSFPIPERAKHGQGHSVPTKPIDNLHRVNNVVPSHIIPSRAIERQPLNQSRVSGVYSRRVINT